MGILLDDYKAIFEHRGHQYNNASKISATARQNEVDALLKLVSFEDEMIVLDAPAGGGIIAKRMEELGLAHSAIICVEPAKQFAAAIPKHLQVLHDEIDQVNVKDASIDIVLSLAGLHHLTDRQKVYQEWHRMLKNDGQLAVSDVRENTPTAEFLNGFVNANNSVGHCGIFIGKTEFAEQLAEQGFQVFHEQLTTVPWTFTDKHQLGLFCKTLFDMDNASSANVVADAINDIVGISEDDSGVHIQWQLQYAQARKA